jgi:hypothetical protein
MREVIAKAPTAGNKARAGLSKEESARFFGPPPLVAHLCIVRANAAGPPGL